MSHKRKYFKYGIVQLEEVFNKSQGNMGALEELEEELQYRKTRRAQKLLTRVKQSLSSSTNEQVNQTLTKKEQPLEVTTARSILIAQQASPTPTPPKLNDSFIETDANEESIDWAEEFANLPDTEIPVEDLTHEALTNRPLDILEAWTAIEAFSPQTYNKSQDLQGAGSVAYLKDSEPWFKNEKSRPSCNLYYVVYLGAIKLDVATDKLLRVYQDKRVERPSQVGNAALGAILVNKNGIPVPETGIALSSFGWAYGQALDGKLEQIKHWELAEKVLCEKLEKLVYQQDEDKKDIPLSIAQLQYIFNWYLKVCKIPQEDIVAPSFAVRLYQPFSKGEPETPLLNSFFLSDLQWAASAVRGDSVNSVLSRYLDDMPPKNSVDLLKDKTQLEDILQPNNTPLARWPGHGRFPLVLLQQVAVNLANRELKQRGLFSVNGPPGTGKTTLLRDIVAHKVVNRAVELCQFENTDDAFEHVGKIKMGKGFVHLYKISDSLRGHEMLVASSNNKAVENISQELPLRSQITDDLSELSYFKTISDGLAEDEDDTWGLIAAVLGNAKNRSNFINKAWWDENTGLKTYFGAITGQVSRDPEDYDDGLVPPVIAGCDAPQNHEHARQKWQQARKTFQHALTRAKQANVAAQNALEATRFLSSYVEQQNAIENEIVKQQAILQRQFKVLEESQAALKKVNSKLDFVQGEVAKHKKTKPGFLKRLFFRGRWQQWRSQDEVLGQKIQEFNQRQKQALNTNRVASANHDESQAQLASWQAKLKHLSQQREKATDAIYKAKDICHEKLVTSELWGATHEQQQVFTPNFLDAAHRMRDDLFVASINMHKAFIDVSAKQIRQNLSAFFFVLGNGKLPADKKAMLPHLWSTAFIFTPVISTTFASVGRMLKNLPANSLGWLLIDEAGQAIPQAAVGAMLRAKRTVAVGDPLQIEPVVTLPLSLVEGICKHHKVDPYHWGAPHSSVQVVADRANRFGASIPRDIEEIRIGSPLLVHRRCENPMFKISNQIAYNRQMVSATLVKESRLTEIYGKSRWFDIQGSAQEKWCPEEGDVVAQMVVKGVRELGNELDLFVISPFKIVEVSMRKQLQRESEMFKQYGIADPDSWIRDHVGTVHTFQGREAQCVILLLGAPSPSQNSARIWATSNVNLLNVAVSRAKQNFYVVGNYQLWSQLGYMKVVSRNL